MTTTSAVPRYLTESDRAELSAVCGEHAPRVTLWLERLCDLTAPLRAADDPTRPERTLRHLSDLFRATLKLRAVLRAPRPKAEDVKSAAERLVLALAMCDDGTRRALFLAKIALNRKKDLEHLDDNGRFWHVFTLAAAALDSDPD